MRGPVSRYLSAGVAAVVLSASLSAQSAIEIADTGARVRNWTVNGETFSAVSRDGGSTWVPLPVPKHYLSWRDRSFDPLLGDPGVPESLMSDDSNELFYVQFVTDIISEYAEALDGMGAEVTRYYPHEAYIVRIPRDKIVAVRGQAFVRAVMELDDGTQARHTDPGRPPRTMSLSTARYNIMLVDKHTDAAHLEQRIQQVGGAARSARRGRRGRSPRP